MHNGDRQNLLCRFTGRELLDGINNHKSDTWASSGCTALLCLTANSATIPHSVLVAEDFHSELESLKLVIVGHIPLLAPWRFSKFLDAVLRVRQKQKRFSWNTRKGAQNLNNRLQRGLWAIGCFLFSCTGEDAEMEVRLAWFDLYQERKLLLWRLSCLMSQQEQVCLKERTSESCRKWSVQNAIPRLMGGT